MSNKRTKISGIAYSGGKIRLPGWDFPVVIELSTLKTGDSLPLLVDHDNRTSSRIGMAKASLHNNVLYMEGEIQSESASAAEIVLQGTNGAGWQLSIGAEPGTEQFVPDSETVNGRLIEGPFYRISGALLREISVVAVGADPEAGCTICASFRMSRLPRTSENNPAPQSPKTNPQPQTKEYKTTMSEEKISDEVRLERNRIHRICTICNGEFRDLQEQAISSGWTPEQTAERALALERAGRFAKNVNTVIHSRPEGADRRKVLEAAMCMRSGVSADDLQGSYSDSVLESGERQSSMPLRELFQECLELEGVSHGGSFNNETIRAAFSTVSLPGILSAVAQKRLLKSFRAQSVAATKLCAKRDLPDFRESARYRLTDISGISKLPQDGIIKTGTFTEEKAVNQLETYAKKFCLTRAMILNDDLDAFNQIPKSMGIQCARLIDKLFFTRLLANPTQGDGKALFHADHGNTISGSTSALTHEGLSKAIQAFLVQTDLSGAHINVEPRYLLVPPALKHTAIELTRGSRLIMAGGNTNVLRPDYNVLSDENLTVVSSPYLSDSAISGYSSKAWYLFADPDTADTFEIAYLRGRHTPTVERGETDFNTLGIWFRCFFDLGIREQDYRGMVRSAGE